MMMQRKWGIVAFGDIRGFGSWTYRAAATREVKDPFILAFYATLQDYVRARDFAIKFKYEGDGFMAIKCFKKEERTPSRISEYLSGLQKLTNQARKDIWGCAYPPPDGFRIRFTSGDMYELWVLDPNDVERQRLIPEYLEYPTNTSKRLLEVNPEIPALATEGVFHVLGRRASSYDGGILKNPSCFPQGVNEEDIRRLRILKGFGEWREP